MNYRELEDLFLSFLILTLLFSNFEIKNVPYAATAVFLAFIAHELAHKYIAKEYGFIAYYRRWDAGIVLALLIGIISKAFMGKHGYSRHLGQFK